MGAKLKHEKTSQFLLYIVIYEINHHNSKLDKLFARVLIEPDFMQRQDTLEVKPVESAPLRPGAECR